MQNIYKSTKNPWGNKPSYAVRFALTYFKERDILDLGVGDGRNAAFLAQQGFQVTGVDKYQEALNQLVGKSRALGVESLIKTKCTRIEDYVFERTHSNIISNFTLHFLKEDDWLQAVQKMKVNTSPGGLNVISDFTNIGSLFRKESTKKWLKLGELKQVYSDWEILYYSEYITRTKRKDENGANITHIATDIVARKNESTKSTL